MKTLEDIGQTKDERYLYVFSAKGTNCDSSVSTVHCTPTLDRLKQITKNEAFQVKVEAILKTVERGDVQLPTKFRYHQQAFLAMLTEIKGM